MGVPPSYLISPPPGKQSATRPWPYPPTMFVHMARDGVTSRAVAADMEQLHQLVSSCFPGSSLWLGAPVARGSCDYPAVPLCKLAGHAPGKTYSSTCCWAAAL